MGLFKFCFILFFVVINVGYFEFRNNVGLFWFFGMYYYEMVCDNVVVFIVLIGVVILFFVCCVMFWS